jgi:hypothetical protein
MGPSGEHRLANLELRPRACRDDATDLTRPRNVRVLEWDVWQTQVYGAFGTRTNRAERRFDYDLAGARHAVLKFSELTVPPSPELDPIAPNQAALVNRVEEVPLKLSSHSGGGQGC